MIELKTPTGYIRIAKNSITAIVETGNVDIPTQIYVVGRNEPFDVINSYSYVCLRMINVDFL